MFVIAEPESNWNRRNFNVDPVLRHVANAIECYRPTRDVARATL